MLNIDKNQIEKLLSLVKQQATSFLNTIEQSRTSEKNIKIASQEMLKTAQILM